MMLTMAGLGGRGRSFRVVVNERARHELYGRLEEVLGPEAATTVIE